MNRRTPLISKFWPVLFLFSIAFTACEKENWNETAKIEFYTETITLGQSFDFNSGNIGVDSLSLAIDDVVVTGSRLQAENIQVGVTLSDIIDFFAEGQALISLDIPQGNYDQMDLYFLSSTPANFSMVLDYDHPGQGQGQNSEDIEIDIHFDLSEIGPLPILNETEQREHLIDSELTYSLSIKFDPEVLFEEVDLGAWNGMINSQNGQGQGQGVVNINENVNENIQNQLLNNVNDAFHVKLYRN